MAYTKKTWVNDTTPIDIAALDHIEEQYKEAIAEVFDGAGIGPMPVTRMPRGTDLYYLKAKGAGSNPEYAEMPHNNMVVPAASDELMNSNDTEQTTMSETWVKVKECKLNANLAGCRIKFDLKQANPHESQQAFGCIYKNGVETGTIRTDKTGDYVTFSEDFTGFVTDDLIQIYAKKDEYGTYAAYVENMRFYYTDEITKLSNRELVVPLVLDDTTPISITNQDP